MKNKGFTLVECILTVTILSILVITIFPILNTSTKLFAHIQVRNDLRNLAQSTIEILKSDHKLGKELLSQLELEDQIEVQEDFVKDEYSCFIRRINTKGLSPVIDVEVIAQYYHGKEVEELAIKASLRK